MSGWFNIPVMERDCFRQFKDCRHWKNGIFVSISVALIEPWQNHKCVKPHLLNWLLIAEYKSQMCYGCFALHCHCFIALCHCSIFLPSNKNLNRILRFYVIIILLLCLIQCRKLPSFFHRANKKSILLLPWLCERLIITLAGHRQDVEAEFEFLRFRIEFKIKIKLSWSKTSPDWNLGKTLLSDFPHALSVAPLDSRCTSLPFLLFFDRLTSTRLQSSYEPNQSPLLTVLWLAKVTRFIDLVAFD